MALPSLDALMRTGAPVVVCARPWAKDLLAAYKLAGFIPMKGRLLEDRNAVREHRRSAGLGKSYGLLLPDSLSSALVFVLAGIPSAGYKDDGRSLLLRWPFAKPGRHLHAVESWYWLTSRALGRWGYGAPSSSPPPHLQLPITSRFEQEGYSVVREAGLQPNDFILIAPTATGLHRGKVKVWPHYDALTRELQSKGVKVIMCPPPSEVEAARKNAPTATLLPPVSLPAFVTLARLSGLVVCNDSGVSHLAAAAGARQLTLFGVTDRDRTGPWSPAAVCMGSSTAWPNLQDVLNQVLQLAPPNRH